ncbi:MAG: glycosyltransferase family 39 protein [Nanoarchaeota archaeon]
MGKNLRRKLIVFWILAAILLVAAVLRFYNIEEESLWLDECFTLSYGSKPINLLVETLKKDVHPIGYYLLQHLLIDYFGSGEMVLRILSVFFGVLSVYLTYLLGRKLFSWKEGLLAAFFVAISYTSILYSQEAKMYSMFGAFFLLSLYSFIMFLKKPSYFNILFFSISIALLLHTHVIGWVILFFYIIFYLSMFILEKKKLESTHSFFKRSMISSRFFLVLLILFLLYLPWLKMLALYQLPLLYNFLGAKLIEKLSLELLPVIMVSVLVVTFAFLALLYLILMDKIDLNRWFGNRGHTKRIFSFFSHETVLFTLILSFIVLDFLLSRYLFSSVSIVRFCFFILPLFYIVLSRVLLRMKRNKLANFLFILLILSASFELYKFYAVDSKEEFRKAAQYIEDEASPNDVLFLHRAGITKLCFDYYYSGQIDEVRVVDPGIDDHYLTERTEGKDHAYLLLSHNYHTKDYFPNRMGSLYKLESEKRFLGITIYKYTIKDD